MTSQEAHQKSSDMDAPAPLLATLDDAPRPRLLGYVAPLDGLRGIAVLTVVAFHAAYLTQDWVANPLPGGFLGVDLFFAISGFLITAGLIDELQSRGSVSYRQFWVRRIRRLVPALAAMVVAVVAVLVVTGWHLTWLGRFKLLTTQQSMWSIVGTLAYVSNWMQAWHMPFPFELSHTWSLAIEMQFYLVWPLVVLAVLRWHWRRSALVAVVVVGIVASATVRALSWTGPSSALALYVRTDTRADVILAGCMGGLAVTWRWLGAKSRAVLRPASVGATIALVVIFVVAHQDATWMYRIGFLLVAVASAALIVGVTVDPDWALGRIFAFGPLVWVGKRSYSIYLWHLPVFIALAAHATWNHPLRLVAGLLLTMVLSEVSYRLVESPLRARPARLLARSPAVTGTR